MSHDSGSVSCETCPSYLAADKAMSKFKKNIGAPMCGRYGHVLGKPDLKPVQILKIQSHFAQNCDSHGDPMPLDPPVKPRTNVALGDPEVIIAGLPAEADRVRVSSCVECVNYVRPEAVIGEMGWPTGLCAATGRLIIPNRLSTEAKNCEWRSPGPNRNSTTGINLIPIFEDAFSMDGDPVKAFLAKRKKGESYNVDPASYSSDKPVSEAQRKAGIAAWRRIEDPDGTGNFTFLPIFNPEHFPESERGKIPKAGDDEHVELYVDHGGLVYQTAVAWRELDETPAVWGIAGTGKTELFRHLAWLMQLPFNRISITAQTDIDDIAGKMLASGGSTFFQYGRVPLCWTKPNVLVVDEPNTGPDEVWQFFRPLTDNSKQLVMDQNGGEILPRHADCYLGFAMNPAWDIRNIGANQISDADGNRLAHLEATLPPDPIERAILEDRCKLDGYEPTRETLDTIMKIAEEIRGLSDMGTLPVSWGIRPQIKVIRLTRWFNLEKSYRLAVGNFMDPEQRQVLMDVVTANSPS